MSPLPRGLLLLAAAIWAAVAAAADGSGAVDTPPPAPSTAAPTPAQVASPAGAPPSPASPQGPAAGTPVEPLSGAHLVETLLGLLVVLAVILALGWAVKRFGGLPGLAGRGRIEILGGVSLGARERVVLIAVEGQRILLGVAPGRVQTLHVLPEAPPTSTAADKDDTFASELRRVTEPPA